MSENFKGLDNQQRSLLSWLAGIIDGEGWAGLIKRCWNKRIGYRVAIQISNRDIRILKRCEEILQIFYQIKVYWGRHLPVVHKVGTPHIWITPEMRKMERLLKDLKELCVSKKDEIKVMLEYIDYKKPELEKRIPKKGVRYLQKVMNIEKESEFYIRLRQIRESRPFRDYIAEDSLTQKKNQDIVHS